MATSATATTETSEKKISEVIDSTHPYFLNSSDSPGMNLINITFDGTSYGNWRRGVLISLSAKNKLGFITGSLPMPEADLNLQDQWARCNNMVIAWLLNSLSKEIAESMIYSQTAKELWDELEERYGQSDGTKLFHLQRELNNISQGTSDIAASFTKLKRTWDQLKEINTFMLCTCECKCGAKSHNHKMNEEQKLIQFLMGLNEGYSSIRGNILMMKPLPSTAQAYSIVLHEESQREVRSGNQVTTDSMAFNAQRWTTQTDYANYRGTNQPMNFGNNNRGYKGTNQPTSYRGPNQSASTDQRRRNNLFCTYCKLDNHVRENCRKLNGYQQSNRNNKPKRNYGNYQKNTQANAALGEEGNGSGTVSGSTVNTLINSQGFTKEQCEQLIHMFQSMQAGGSGVSSSNVDANANLAGPFDEEGTDFW